MNRSRQTTPPTQREARQLLLWLPTRPVPPQPARVRQRLADLRALLVARIDAARQQGAIEAARSVDR